MAGAKATVHTISLEEVKRYLTAAGGGESISGFPFPEGDWKYARFDLATLGNIAPGDSDVLGVEVNVKFGIFLGGEVETNDDHFTSSFSFDGDLQHKVDAEASDLMNKNLVSNDGYNPWCIKYTGFADAPCRSIVAYKPTPVRFMKESFKYFMSNGNRIIQRGIISGHIDLIYIPAEGGAR